MKIFSLNIWFDNYLIKDRTITLIDYLLKNDFDVIALQEVTKPVLSVIFKSIQHKYEHIHTNLDDDISYGICIISKTPITDRQNYKFKNSRMNRSLIFGKINDIIFSTSHFESEFYNIHVNKKIEQFNQTFELLSRFNKVFFIGDTNLTKKDENFICHQNFDDIYLLIDNSKDNLYTYDGVSNPYINNKIRSRVDRAYIKNIHPKSFSNENNIIMSDHYGLTVEI